jgi:hypothetical protein
MAIRQEIGPLGHFSAVFLNWWFPSLDDPS